LASAGVLYIFQFAAISALRAIFSRTPYFDFMGLNPAIRVTAGTSTRLRARAG
jgi:hypothetical protein